MFTAVNARWSHCLHAERSHVIQIECVIDLFPEVRCHLDPSILPMDANTIVPGYAVDNQSALAPIDLPDTNVATKRMPASLLYNS